jgi:urease accessory protein UreH
LPGCNPAIVQSSYVVEADAELHCHWDPVIPFARAGLEQRFDLRIAANSRFYWGDAVMAGRVSRGEAWQFASLSHELGLRVDGSLAYMERYTLNPRERALDQPWTAGRARYFATSLVHHRDATRDIAEGWQRTLATPDAGVRAGIDLVAPGLIAARVTAADGAPFSRFRASYRAAALEDIFRAPELAGRK